jgi:AcrR family transcriptional regulator
MTYPTLTIPSLTQVNGVDPRVKRTRQLLLQAFVELLAEKGFRALSVQDIAERATVNRATFYAHFEDKYALMESFIREGFEQMLASKLPASALFTQDNLHLLIRTVFEYLAQVHDGQCPSSDRQIEPMFEATVQGELYKFILNWLKQTPPPGSQCRVAIDTAAIAMSWAIFGAGLQWSRGARKTSAEEMADQVAAVLTGGLPVAVKLPFLEQQKQNGQRVR